jgi:hypothetical protein
VVIEYPSNQEHPLCADPGCKNVDAGIDGSILRTVEATCDESADCDPKMVCCETRQNCVGPLEFVVCRRRQDCLEPCDSLLRRVGEPARAGTPRGAILARWSATEGAILRPEHRPPSLPLAFPWLGANSRGDRGLSKRGAPAEPTEGSAHRLGTAARGAMLNTLGRDS